jgi:hypothetical protein
VQDEFAIALLAQGLLHDFECDGHREEGAHVGFGKKQRH